VNDDANIVAALADRGIDSARLGKVLAPRAEGWGDLVYAYEILAVLGVVHHAMLEAEHND
jgi:hypothetical protein